MKKLNRILWGIALVALGTVFSLNILGITDFEIFFDGWWTLFIIVPCAIGLVTTKNFVGNLIGLGVGVALLLGCLDILDLGMLWKLFIPFVIIVIGLRLIFGNLFSGNTEKIRKKIAEKNQTMDEFCATFSGHRVDFSGKEFYGAELTAVFGSVKLDLRNAIIADEALIKVSSIFGGVDILLPEGVSLKVVSNSIFGGVSNKYKDAAKEKTIKVYVDAMCLFGGADIK